MRTSMISRNVKKTQPRLTQCASKMGSPTTYIWTWCLIAAGIMTRISTMLRNARKTLLKPTRCTSTTPRNIGSSWTRAVIQCLTPPYLWVRLLNSLGSYRYYDEDFNDLDKREKDTTETNTMYVPSDQCNGHFVESIVFNQYTWLVLMVNH